MPEKSEIISNPVLDQNQKLAAALNPKEFIGRYLHYLPWLIVSVILFILLGYIKIRYTTPIYHMQASLMIKNEDNAIGGGHDQRFGDLFLNQGSINMNNEIEILKSRPVLLRVALDLNLEQSVYSKGNIRSSMQYNFSPIRLIAIKINDSSTSKIFTVNILNDNEFLLNEQTKPTRFGAAFAINGDSFAVVRNFVYGLHLFPVRQFEVSWVPWKQVVENIRANLNIIQPNDQATILTLSYESESTELGKSILNTLMAVYDSLIVEDKSRIANITLRFIDDRLKNLKDELSNVQGNLKDYMAKNQAYDIEGQSKTYFETLTSNSKGEAEQEIKVSVVNWLMDYIKNTKNKYTLVPTMVGIEEPALLQLVTEYNRLQLERENNLKTTQPDNPLIQSYNTALDKVRSDMYQALSNVRQSILLAKKDFQDQQLSLKGTIQQLPGKSMQILNITRQQKILEDLYSFLLQKKLETSISSASTISNSKIVESAVTSDVPVSPNHKKMYTTYLLLGLSIPIGIIVLIELLRDKIRNRADVERNTSAPILGEVGHSSSERTLVVSMNNRHFIGEQFRNIRTNLQYMIAKKEKPVIMVTSSFSGEGKSFISTNVAAAIALTGKKTVIMEFDIRKPKIISGLDLKRKMGITNYIIGKASFQEMILKVDGIDNLYVIPCGPIPPNPAEILLDQQMNLLMKEAREAFDVVIMDTAPVGLVSDALNLARFADCSLYIVRQGYTFRKQIQIIEELYTQQKLPRIALLLNDVKAEGGYGGGYGYYGSYSYGMKSGYFEDDHKKSGFFSRLFRKSKSK